LGPPQRTAWMGLLKMMPVDRLCFTRWWRRTNIHMSSLPHSVCRNFRSQFDENRGKTRLLGSTRGGTSRKKGSLNLATSGSIVLWVIMETNKPSLRTLYGPNLLISPSTAKMAKSERKWRFPMPTIAKTGRTEGSFKLALSGSMALNAMVQKRKPSLDTIPCFSQPQSPSTATTKTATFQHFSACKVPNEEEKWIFRRFHQWINCIWNVDRGDRPITCNNSLSKSSDISVYR